jgi:hypothetical protein
VDPPWYSDIHFFFLTSSILAVASVVVYLIMMLALQVGFDAERILNIFVLVINGTLPPATARLWMLCYVTSPAELEPFSGEDMIFLLAGAACLLVIFVWTIYYTCYVALKRARRTNNITREKLP